MLDKPLLPYGSDHPQKLMDKLYQMGNETLLSLRNLVTSPNSHKKPRTWGSMETAKMVGVSDPTFRKLLEKYEEIPGIITEGSEKNQNIKKYTLQAINFLRDKAGTRYKRPNDSKALTIAISNLKGGVGKTQTAVDLGKKIAMEGLRVLLLDFDAQGSATLLSSGFIPDLELQYTDTITNTLIADPSQIHNIILKTHFEGFDIIPANLAIQDCDLILPNPKKNNAEKLGAPFSRLTKALDLIKDQYDIILIDCGPNLGALTLNAIVACDGMIIPIPPSMSDYSSFVMYTATLRNLFNSLEGKKLAYLRILLTKHNGNSNPNKGTTHSGGNKEALEMEGMMRQQFGQYILTNYMCETVEVAKAATEIGTIYDVSKPRGSREAYRRAIQHLDNVNMEIINHFKEIWFQQTVLANKNEKEKAHAI